VPKEAKCYDPPVNEDGPAPPERATPLLAIVRIVSVLGMSFAIALGLFLLLGAWWWQALVSFAAAVPFFFAMRYMERRAAGE